MCHLVLLLPLVALPIFWLAPLSVSVPIYSAVVIVSVCVYYLAFKAMRQPVVTGVESMLHAIGKVVERRDYDFQVSVNGETWSARADEDLAIGDKVEIVSIDGLTLKVRHAR